MPGKSKARPAAPDDGKPTKDGDGKGRSTGKSAKPDRRKAPQTREAILDAAEALFAQHGYNGASIRDISKSAGVQQALTYYHFGSKEDLFRAVIDRRAEDNAGGLRSALQEVVAASGEEPPDLEALLRAFLQPVVDRALRRGEGWRNYIRLLAQVGSQPQEESFIVPVNEHYDAVVRDFIRELGSIFPKLSPEDVHWGFYFFQAVITNVLIETGMVDRQSDGLCRSAELDTIVEKMTRFFAAGYRGIAQQ